MFASCKKSDSGQPANHVSGSVDGAAKSFNYTTSATKVTNGSMNSVSIMGVADATGTATLNIAVQNFNGPITPGSYIDTVSSKGQIGLNYMFPALNQVYMGGTAVYFNATTAITNHLKVVIASIDSVSVKGTFSGDVFLQGNSSSTKKTITNGDFNVKFK
jgi:hypothetical protein